MKSAGVKFTDGTILSSLSQVPNINTVGTISSGGTNINTLFKSKTTDLSPTGETLTGDYFLGHPVYRKRLKGTFGSDGSGLQHFTGLSNIKALVNIWGLVQRSGYNWNSTTGDARVYTLSSHTSVGQLANEIWVDRANDRITLSQVNAWWLSQPYQFVIEYIKEDGSGNGLGDY